MAAVSLDASMVLELLSPLAPAYFLPIASVANIGACKHGVVGFSDMPVSAICTLVGGVIGVCGRCSFDAD